MNSLQDKIAALKAGEPDPSFVECSDVRAVVAKVIVLEEQVRVLREALEELLEAEHLDALETAPTKDTITVRLVDARQQSRAAIAATDMGE